MRTKMMMAKKVDDEPTNDKRTTVAISIPAFLLKIIKHRAKEDRRNVSSMCEVLMFEAIKAREAKEAAEDSHA